MSVKRIAIRSLVGVIALAILGYLGLVLDESMQEPPKPTVAAALVGNWQGLLYLEGQEIRVEVEINKDPSGKLLGSIDFRDASVLDVPVKVKHRNYTIKLSQGRRSIIEGQLSEDLQSIKGRLFVATMGEWKDLVLKKDNPAFRRFALPRLSDSGEGELEYSYQSPEQAKDGWPVSSLSAEGFDDQLIGKLIESVLQGEHGRPEAILIARNGKLVLEEYFYGFGRDRLHPIQSVTKSVASLLFGIAKDKGLVANLDLPVYGFFDDYQGRRWIDQQYPISLVHLLTMSAAVEWSDEGQGSTTAMLRSGDWIGYTLDLKQIGQPGESALYSSGLSILLGDIIRRVSGKPLSNFAEETLFADLGVSKYRWRTAPDGTNHTGGGLVLTAYDLAKMGQLVLGKGLWKGKRVISESWVNDSWNEQLPLMEESVRASGGSRYPQGYGYQWWILGYEVNGESVEAIAGQGYGGQYLGIFPSLGTVIVLFNGEWGNPWERVFDYHEIVEQWILPAIQ